MAKFPHSNEDDTTRSGDTGGKDDPIVTCEFQDGTLRVYEDSVHIDRSSRSKFADKEIPMARIAGVTYSKRLVISYIQIQQSGVDTDGEGLLSTPVDENTLHFGRGKRACAKRAAGAIRSRIDSTSAR